MNKKKIIQSLAAVVFIINSMQGFPLDFSLINQEKRPGIFKSDTELRKEQLENVRTSYKTFEQKAVELKKSLNEKLNEISTALAQVDAALVELKEKPKEGKYKEEEEFLNQKSLKLNERKQILINTQEALSATEETYSKYGKLLKDFIEHLSKREGITEFKAYSLKDVKDAQNVVVSFADEVRSTTFNKNELLKSLKAEEAQVIALQKRIDEAIAEQKKVREDIRNKTTAPSVEKVKQDQEIAQLSLANLVEQKNYAEIDQTKLGLEIKYKDDLIKFNELKLNQSKKRLSMLQEQVYIDPKDVENAKEDLAHEQQQSLEAKGLLIRQRSAKKSKKEALRSMRLSIDESIKRLAVAGKENEPQTRSASAELQKFDAQIGKLEKDINLFDIKTDLEDDKILLKDVIAKSIDVLYRLQQKNFDQRDLDKWINEFSDVVKKQETEIVALNEKIVDMRNFLTHTRKEIDTLKARLEEEKKQKNTIYQGYSVAYNEVISSLEETLVSLENQINLSQEHFWINSEAIRLKADINRQATFVMSELEAKGKIDIWKRSSRAISLTVLWTALTEAEGFLREFVWQIPSLFHMRALIHEFKGLTLNDYIGILLFIAFALLVFWLFRFFLILVKKYTQKTLEVKDAHERVGFLVKNVLISAIDVVLANYKRFFFWLFIQIDLLVRFKNYFGPFRHFPSYSDSTHLTTCFYIFTIPILITLSTKLVRALGSLNHRLNFELCPEPLEWYYGTILKYVLYLTIILLQFRKAYLINMGHATQLPEVIYAATTLIWQFAAVFFLIIHREDVLGIYTPKESLSKRVKGLLEYYYEAILLFVTLLIVLSNPYIGYPNLAFLLLYAVPLSTFLLYVMSYVHYYIRTFSAYWFIYEEDNDVFDRFEHAKTYYGIFIILSFIVLATFTFILVGRVWGVPVTPDSMLTILRDTWTINVSGEKLGLIQFATFITFITSGFLVSTFLDKVVLLKVFDIFRLDSGVRNTVTSILHYCIMYIVIVLGLSAIKLTGFIGWISFGIGGAIAFGAKDLIADFLAGFLILIERPVQIGSFIETGQIRGTVIKLSPRSITLRTALHRHIIIPNNSLINKPILNWNYGRTYVGFDIEIPVAYKTNIEKVHALLKKITEEESRVLKTPPFIFRVEEFKETGMLLILRVFISGRRAREKWDIASDMRDEIVKLFRKNNIEMPLPQSIVHLRNHGGDPRHEEQSE
jgi:small-conductance mechanosensitive channel